MSIVKSYTDLPQSQRLSKILNHETADMLWGYYYNGENHCVPNIRPFRDGRNEIPKGYIPAWSLAALLNVVSKEVSLNSFKDGNWNAMVQQNGKVIYGDASNPIDSCVEMIEKLHEQKLL